MRWPSRLWLKLLAVPLQLAAAGAGSVVLLLFLKALGGTRLGQAELPVLLACPLVLGGGVIASWKAYPGSWRRWAGAIVLLSGCGVPPLQVAEDRQRQQLEHQVLCERICPGGRVVFSYSSPRGDEISNDPALALQNRAAQAGCPCKIEVHAPSEEEHGW